MTVDSPRPSHFFQRFERFIVIKEVKVEFEDIVANEDILSIALYFIWIG
jgi:hypothetical protein